MTKELIGVIQLKKYRTLRSHYVLDLDSEQKGDSSGPAPSESKTRELTSAPNKTAN